MVAAGDAGVYTSAAMRRSNWLLLSGLVLGLPAGVGAFTFVYAKGFSYLSADPRACINCHIMNEQYDAWSKSGHRHTATCVDCHLPHAGVAKWIAKADHGFRHSAAFTLQNFAEPIAITPRDRSIVRANCIRCHQSVDESMNPAAEESARHDCMHCHQTAGHGAAG